MTGGTKKDVDAMAVLLINIQDKCPNLADEAVIYHDGISKKKQLVMNKIMPVRFIRYRTPFKRRKMFLNRTLRYFSPMIFCKYEAFELLKEYDQVIWSDYDILIKENIEELRYISGNFSTIYNKEDNLKDMFYPTIKKFNMNQYKMEGGCMVTPLFILRKDLENADILKDWCYKQTDKYMRHLYLPEQCIFTMLLQHFNIKFNIIETKKYCTHPKFDDADVKTLHPSGQPKFWNGLTNLQWNQYYAKWKSMN